MQVRFPFSATLGAVSLTQGVGDADPSHIGVLHNSLDFDVPFDTEVLAIADGVVVDYFHGAQDGEAGAGGAGNLVTIRHADGVYSTVMHLAPNSIPQWIRDAVDEGQEPDVLAGQVLGLVGNTGTLVSETGGDGSHIHLTVGTQTIGWGASTGHNVLIADGSAAPDGSLPVRFEETGDVVPTVSGDIYTSLNNSIDTDTGPIAPEDLKFLISDLSGEFALYNIDNNDITQTGNFGKQVTDIAQAAYGEVFAIDFNSMYRVDPRAGDTTFLYNLPIPKANSLTVYEGNGGAQAIIAGGNRWAQIYAETGASILSGNLPSGHTATGDVILLRDTDGSPSDFIFSTERFGNPYLVRYEVGGGEPIIEEHPINDLWGLANGRDGEGFFGFSGQTIYRFELDPLVGQGLRGFGDIGLTEISGATRIMSPRTGLLDGTMVTVQPYLPDLGTPHGSPRIAVVDSVTSIRDLSALFPQVSPAPVPATVELRGDVLNYTVTASFSGRYATVDPDTGFNGFGFTFNEITENPNISLRTAHVISAGTTLSEFDDSFVHNDTDTLLIDLNGLSYRPLDRLGIQLGFAIQAEDGQGPVRGGTGPDHLSGSDSYDRFIASSGNDRIDGGSGGGEVIFQGLREYYQITRGAEPETLNVADTRLSMINQGSDTLLNIDRLVFSNGDVSVSKLIGVSENDPQPEPDPQPVPEPGDAAPVDTSPLVMSAPAGWNDDGNGGVVNADGGAVFLGHVQGEAALLRIENGSVAIESSGRVTVDGDVYAVRGGLERPLFSGSFAVEPGTLSATGFSPRSDGYGLLNGLVDIDFSRLTFSENDVALGADLDFPAPFDALDTAGGPLALRFGAEGLSFGPGQVGTSNWLPDIELPLSGGSLIDLTFSDMGVDYDGLSDSLYFSGAATLVWGGTIKDYFDGLAFVPLQDLEFDLSGERTGDALFERGDKFLRLQHQDGDLAWDIVGDVTYSSTAGFLRELSLGINSIDETFSGSITGAFSFASERTVTGEISGLWDPIAIDSVRFGMDGLDLPVASTGLFLQGGSLGVDGLADGGSGGQSYSGKVDYTYGSAAGGLPTPIRGDIDGSFETGSVGGGFSIRSTPGYILGDATSGGIVDIMDTYFGVDPSAVLDFELLDASGEIEANFANESLHAELDAFVLGGLFKGRADLAMFDDAGIPTLEFGAQGALQFPEAIPVIGGVGVNGNIALEYSADGDLSNDFIAAWTTIDLGLGEYDTGLQVSFDGDFQRLNSDIIELIGSWELAPENEIVLISAEWETARENAELVVITPDGTRLSETDVAGREDIAIAQALTTPTARHVALETPAAGIWDIEMVDPAGLGEITYSASKVLTGPSLTLGIAADDYAAERAELTLSAEGMAAGSEIVINALANRDDAAGTRLRIDALQSGDGTQTVTWDYADFDPGIYHLEAVARGGGLAPEAALAEATVTVDALIEGAVTGPGGIALPDTALRFSLDGVEAGKAQTDAQGGFSLRAPPEIAGKISLERAVTAEERDGITASDALETLRLAVGLDPSWGPADGFDFVAADFNGDGAVTASDALDILRIAVGLDTGSNQPRWVFGELEADDVNANDVPNLDSQVDITPLTADAQVNAQGVLVGNMEDYVV